MKVRKKPVVVEAVQFTATNPITDMPQWLLDAVMLPVGSVGRVWRVENHFHIATLEGDMTGETGDWIIRGVKGELYPCKPDIFEATYEPADA